MIDIKIVIFLMHIVYSVCIVYMLLNLNIATSAYLAYVSLSLFLISSICMLIGVSSGKFLEWLLVAECFRLTGAFFASRALNYVRATK